MKKVLFVIVAIGSIILGGCSEGVEQPEKQTKEFNSIYTWKDAEVFEKYVLDMNRKEQSAEFVAKNLSFFIEDVKTKVSKPDYFNKLKEVQKALQSENYNQVPNLIKEATKIRESQ